VQEPRYEETRTRNELNHRERELVALGAAIASNCLPCIEYHVPEARRTGLADIQIREAVRIADEVRRVPARAVAAGGTGETRESPERLG
jgi:AhpD family alkylhydroperoxidase